MKKNLLTQLLEIAVLEYMLVIGSIIIVAGIASVLLVIVYLCGII